MKLCGIDRSVGEPEEEANAHALYHKGAAAWPELSLTESAFVSHLRALSGARNPGLRVPRHPGDLYLACACAQGMVPALRAFEACVGPEIDASLRRFASDPDTRGELRQRVRALLFAHPGGGKIAKYAGTSPLAYWARLVAIRTARNYFRSGGDRGPISDRMVEADAIAARDVEGAVMKAELLPLFKSAFATAWGALEPRERTLLRWSIVDGLSIDALAQLLHVHRATAARRVAIVRERLSTLTREQIRMCAGFSQEEYESALHLIESQLEVSVSRIFGGGEADAG